MSRTVFSSFSFAHLPLPAALARSSKSFKWVWSLHWWEDGAKHKVKCTNQEHYTYNHILLKIHSKENWVEKPWYIVGTISLLGWSCYTLGRPSTSVSILLILSLLYTRLNSIIWNSINKTIKNCGPLPLFKNLLTNYWPIQF